MNADSTRRTSSGKARISTPASTPKKPRKDFPLNIHKGSGHWCKKVKGKVYYFGKVVDDPEGRSALEEWLRVKDDLQAGREPREKNDDDLTIADLCNQFLAHKELLRDNGELNVRTFRGYYDTAATVVKLIGKNRAVTDLTPDDFRKLRTKLAKTRGAVSLRNEMQRVRSIFKFAFDDGLILAPIRFGQGFAKPKLDTVRRAREERRSKYGDRMFNAHEIRQILDVVSQPLKVMILIAANCGFGQSDLSNLPIRSVNLETGWLDFARVKTAVPRRIPLWPETIEAIREWLHQRTPANKAILHRKNAMFFKTRNGARIGDLYMSVIYTSELANANAFDYQLQLAECEYGFSDCRPTYAVEFSQSERSASAENVKTSGSSYCTCPTGAPDLFPNAAYRLSRFDGKDRWKNQVLHTDIMIQNADTLNLTVAVVGCSWLMTKTAARGSRRAVDLRR